jgi:hypothetical protein
MAATQTVGWIRSHGRKATAFALFALVLLTALAFASSSKAAVESPPPPSVWSDKADYAPGELVTLSGANWGPGEAVHIRVNDDAGETWRRDVDVTADESGAISDQFNLPDWFVAQYTVTATGASSGTATWSFTDGNVTLHPGPAGDGVTQYRVTFDVWDGTSTDCGVTGAASPTAPLNRTLTVTSPNNTNIPGFGGSTSSALLKTVTVLAPATGKTFDKWTSGDNKDDAGTTVASPACVTNNNSSGSGNLTDLYAHFKNANAAPVCNNGSATTNEDTAVAATLNCTDADGNSLTYTIVSGPTKGILSGTAPNLTYTPNANANGSDSFTFKANDGTVDSNAATFSLTINAVNDAPVANALSVTTNEDTAKLIALAGSDVDGNNLSFSIVSSPTHGALGSIGSVTCTGTAPKSCSADVTYTPTLNYNGSDSFSFKVNDGTVDSSAATVSITVTAVNDAPTATVSLSDHSPKTNDTLTATATRADVDGDAVSLRYVWKVNGTVKRDMTKSAGTAADLTDTFNLATSGNGDKGDVIRVEVTPNDGTVNGATVNDTATVVNSPPAATNVLLNNTSPTTNQTISVSYTYADDDGDAESGTTFQWQKKSPGDPDFTNITGANSSSLNLASAGNGDKGDQLRVLVTPKDGISFGTGVLSNVATVVNSPPVVTLDGGNSYAFDESTTAQRTFNFTATDDDSDTLSISVDCGPGTYVSQTASSFKCVFPDGPVPGGSEISVSADDGDGGTDSDSHAIMINNVAPTIAFTTAPASVSESTSANVTYNFSISDPGDDVSAYVTGYPDCGSKGSLQGTPTIGATSGSFQCRFPDGDESSTVTVKVNDGDDDSNLLSQPVAIANVAPSVTLSGPNDVNENKTGSESYSFTVIDPGNDGFTVSTGYPKCGSNGEVVMGSLTTTAHGGSFACRFKDGDASSTVEIKVRDADEGAGSTTADSNVASINVTIHNVAPTVNLTGETTVDEGSSHTYAFTVTDPGDDTFVVSATYPKCGLHGEYVAGSLSVTSSGGSFGCRFPDGPNTTDVAIKVADSDGASTTDSEKVVVVTVENVPPAVTAPADQSSNEGEGHSFTLGSFTDPGADTWTVDVDWGDGSPHSAPALGSQGTIPATNHTYVDNGAYVVTVKVTDSDNDFDAESFNVTVSNVPPTVTLSGPLTANEGDSKNYTYTWTDPGAADTFPAAGNSVSCGINGSSSAEVFDASAKTGSFTCTWSDDSGAGTAAVSATVTDNDGGVGTNTKQVDVENVAPTASFANTGPVDEGSSFTLKMENGDDVSSVDKAAKFTFAFDCGDGSGYSAFSSAAALSASTSCSTNDNGTRSVKAKIKDKDGGVREYTASVTVNNVPPTVTFTSGPTTANEGETKSYSYSWSDPGSADTFPNHSVDCGPKGTALNETYTPASKTGSFDCRFGDDSGAATFAVKATVKDDDGGEGSDTKQVDVDNVNPTASNPGFVFDPVLGSATASFSFSDVGYLDTHQASFFTWSAGIAGLKTVTEENLYPNATGDASETRTFVAGCYNLTVTGTAKDDDGGMSAPLSIFSGSTTGVYANGFRPPIQDNERNIAKYGNVVPVKVVLTNPCTGASVTNVSLFITTVQGAGAEIIEDTNVVAESVSAADSGAQMRVADSMYIYNLTTKTMTAGKDYTIRVRLGSATGPIILAAVLQPKK